MHHSIDICYDIARKLSNPQKIQMFFHEQTVRNPNHLISGRELSLAWGMPGIICFFAAMDATFPNEGWDKIARDYIDHLQTHLNPEFFSNGSLYSGLGGICFAIELCSQNGLRYQKILSKLEDIFVDTVRSFYLTQVDKYTNPYEFVPHDFYNLAHGLSGIITYSMHRNNLVELACDCVSGLIKILLSKKNIHYNDVFAWYNPPEEDSPFQYSDRFSNGYYRLDTPFGLAGVLGVLSLAANNQMRIENLEELIEKLSRWMMNRQIRYNNRLYWNRITAIDEKIEEEIIIERRRDNWLFGTPAVTRSLYLASKAISDPLMSKFSEEVFISHIEGLLLQESMQESSFCYGKAGLLVLAHRMGCDTQNPRFFQASKTIEENLKSSFSPLYEFGFQSIDLENETTSWVDKPGLIDGAAGIGLSLLEVQGRSKVPWGRAFMVSK